MKKISKFLLAVIFALCIFTLPACGTKSETSTDNSGKTTQPTDNPGGTGQSTDNPGGGTQNDDATKLASYKRAALTKLDEVVNPVIDKTENDDLKTSILNFYNTEKAYINGITNVDTAKETSNKVVADVKTFVKDTLLPLAVEKINAVVNPLINQITYTELKTAVQLYYDTEIAKVARVETLDGVVTSYKGIIDDTKKFIKDKTEEILIGLKNKALEELNPYVTALINKISNDTLKTNIQSFYNTEKAKLDAVSTFDGFAPCVNEIKTDLEKFTLAELKKIAIAKLDEVVNPVLDKITNDDLKTSIRSFYNTEKAYINGITSIDTAKDAANKVVADSKTFVKDTLLPLAVEKINAVVNPLISQITDTKLKSEAQSYYETEMAKVASVGTLNDVANIYKEIIDDTKKFIKDNAEASFIALKNKALEELDPYVIALINKIPYNGLKTDVQSFYNAEKAKLDAVDSFDGFTPCVNEIKADLETYALAEIKKIAVAELEEFVASVLARVPNSDIKADLTSFAAVEIAKINAITKIDDVSMTMVTVTNETKMYVQNLLASNIKTVKDYLARLTAVESATAYDYLPAAMSPKFEGNKVTVASITYDFTNHTSVSSINRAGYGEQWQMVVENIDQSVALAKVFNVAQTALNAAGQAVDIYITSAYAEEMSYTFSGNGYTGLFEFKDRKLKFYITLTTSVTIPIVGSVKPVIQMEYDLTTDAKGVFISFGDAYKVKYVVTENAYEMATTYGITIAGKSVTRSTYLSIEKENGKTTGHIYEYTTYQGSDKIKACADFYVENGYVSVVGNKASGMMAFKGYVNELYLASEGRLLGYEVREEMTIAGVTGTYNTLWFNLWDISGISSVKVTEKTDANESNKSTVDVYLNGSSSLLSPTYNTKFTVKTSRKYDVELRTRYYYTYDLENDKYVANKVEVPMMFIQEGSNFNSFTDDIKKDNNITASVSLNANHLNKILADYDTLIDIFIVNKENMSSEQIITYLSQYE